MTRTGIASDRPAEVKVVLTGGAARYRSYELVDSLATLVLKEVFLDVTILGANALSAVDGASAENESEADTTCCSSSGHVR